MNEYLHIITLTNSVLTMMQHNFNMGCITKMQNVSHIEPTGDKSDQKWLLKCSIHSSVQSVYPDDKKTVNLPFIIHGRHRNGHHLRMLPRKSVE